MMRTPRGRLDGLQARPRAILEPQPPTWVPTGYRTAQLDAEV